MNGSDLLRELARPVVLVLCILSLYAVFQAAFFEPASDVPQRLRESLARLGLSATVCILSGWLFRDGKPWPKGSLVKTLPMQLLCWASAVMGVLFAAASYIETYSVFESHVRN